MRRGRGGAHSRTKHQRVPGGRTGKCPDPEAGLIPSRELGARAGADFNQRVPQMFNYLEANLEGGDTEEGTLRR